MSEIQDQLDIDIKPEIYSRRPIFWFAFLITPLFGGILLMSNLKKLEKSKEATSVFLISLLMTAIVVFAFVYFDIQSRAVQFIYNLVCAGFLADVLYKKYIPDADEYPKKSIWLPLIVAIVIIVSLILLAFWAQDQVV